MDPLTPPAHISDVTRPSAPASQGRKEILLALAAFAVLCTAVLSVAPYLVEPDDFAYRASTVAITQGHLLTLTTAQVHALAAQVAPTGRSLYIPQWVQLSSGRWISEKNPGYPFLAAPFQLLGIIRLAPLFYGALGCLGLFAGGRRWLGRFGGAAAVGLFCSSGAALLFAWRGYMPMFTEASLIAAGTGALLWTVLAAETASRRRTWAGLGGFVALEAAVFVRYTDIAVLGCAVVAVAAAWRLRPAKLPAGTLGWWLGSVVVFAAGVALFNNVAYGGPLTPGYVPGEITFSLSAVLPNFRYMPAHLIEAMPMLVLGLAAVAWIAARWARLRRADGDPAALARRDFAAGLALAGSWFSVWGLYAAYTWTAHPAFSTLQVARFYVPATGAISLLGAWLVTRLPRRASPAVVASVAVVIAMFGLGAWSFSNMRESARPLHPARHQLSRNAGDAAASGANACRAAKGLGRTGEPGARTGRRPLAFFPAGSTRARPISLPPCTQAHRMPGPTCVLGLVCSHTQ
jgi:hypothetical protein